MGLSFSRMSEAHESEDDLEELGSADDPSEHFATLFEAYRPRLERAVSLRLDARVRARIDPADVVQEAYLECERRLQAYLAEPAAPPFLWARFLALERLLQLHREHLGRQKRDAAREVSIHQGRVAGASSWAIAARLVDRHTTPTQAARRSESRERVTAAFEEMDELDREILVLRHFEQLNSAEAGRVLGITHDAARKRYLRALERMKRVLDRGSVD